MSAGVLEERGSCRIAAGQCVNKSNIQMDPLVLSIGSDHHFHHYNYRWQTERGLLGLLF